MPPTPAPAFHDEKPLPARWFRNSWIIFACALALRVAIIFNFHLYRVPAQPGNHFGFGWEMGRIARAIASGRGYADPFHGHSGPTAWVAPVYPYLTAGVFRLLGIYSDASALLLMLLNALFGALTILPVRTIAARCFGRKVALASMWAWALWPFAMQYIAHLRDGSLTALLFTCAIALTIRIRGIGAPPERANGVAPLRDWLLLGFLWGVLALTDPSVLLVLPASFLWLLAASWKQHQPARFRQQFRNATLAVLLSIACVAPWAVRNTLVFHKFVPIRSDLGEELYLGNGPGSNSIPMVWKHPYESPRQFRLYRSMGEVAYCNLRGRQAVAFIRSHPAHFLRDSLLRFFYFWFGVPQGTYRFFLDRAPTANVIFTTTCGFLAVILAFRKRVPGAGLFALIMLCYPLVFYCVIVESHHRYLLEPILYILTVYLWTSAEESNRVRILSPSWWRNRLHPQP